MRLSRRSIVAALAATLLFVGAGCLGGGSNIQLRPVTLDYWRTQDAAASLDDAVEAYRKLHPNVTINVRMLREEDYERELLEALAEDRGPDLFSIPNTRLEEWKGKVLPLPKEIAVPTQVAQGDKIVVTAPKKATLSLIDLRSRYVEGVVPDLIGLLVEKPETPPVERIFGLTYSADTLALFYNKDAFRKANIEKPPATWTDFRDAAMKLTIIDPDGTIRQSGAAIGGGKNVRHATDIIVALMMQNGAEMVDEGGYPKFSSFTRETTGRAMPPGVDALVFYQSFATRGAPAYVWNETLPDSLDAFVTGRTVMFLGFPSDIAKIRERAPRLDFGVAPLPVINPARPANVLHYPVEVVAASTESPNEAWDFLQFAASQEQVGTFLAKTGRPTALRGLLAAQVNDPAIGPFAGQVLNARQWYEGKDYTEAEEAFRWMATMRPNEEFGDYLRIVSEGADRVGATYYD